MATIIEDVKVKCRNPEEYYELKDTYTREGYTITESDDSSCLDFFAKREYKIWELK